VRGEHAVRGGYAAFIENYTGRRYAPGPFADSSGACLGSHGGIVRYTVGQRRGLGAPPSDKRLYVTAVDAASNTVVLGGADELYAKSLTASGVNLIALPAIDGTMRVSAKIRYGRLEQPATVRQTAPDEIHVEFDSAQRAITPGQAAVLYDGDVVVGGGIITGTGRPC
jgi:tRNA-specific 2-thiouridylase